MLPGTRRPVAGKVLFRRENRLMASLGRDSRSRKVLLLLTAIVVLGGVLTVAIMPLLEFMPAQEGQARLIFEVIIAVLAVSLFFLAARLSFEDRGDTVITDRGILYGGIFRRWADIRCCVMRKTRRGLVVWVRAKGRIRLYFGGDDTDRVERLFRDFCSADAFSPDCSH
jgi:hypothetical protein